MEENLSSLQKRSRKQVLRAAYARKKHPKLTDYKTDSWRALSHFFAGALSMKEGRRAGKGHYKKAASGGTPHRSE